jgi:hypothetical protein
VFGANPESIPQAAGCIWKPAEALFIGGSGLNLAGLEVSARNAGMVSQS